MARREQVVCFTVGWFQENLQPQPRQTSNVTSFTNIIQQSLRTALGSPRTLPDALKSVTSRKTGFRGSGAVISSVCSIVDGERRHKGGVPGNKACAMPLSRMLDYHNDFIQSKTFVRCLVVQSRLFSALLLISLFHRNMLPYLGSSLHLEHCLLRDLDVLWNHGSTSTTAWHTTDHLYPVRTRTTKVPVEMPTMILSPTSPHTRAG